MPGNNPWVFTENKYMKNLIIKWLGLEGLMDLRITQLQPGTVDAVIYDLNNRYDLEGLTSKFDDYIGTVDDLEYKADNWDCMADKIEDLEINDIVADIEAKLDLDKIQQLDDQLTELLAGYKLDVQLVKEDF
tara:strand:- start:11 stop:406 length:396 start_codon:yes stop_codon:yes gene_type:complete